MNDNDYERRFCQKCDVYRGYTCAEHREPSYESMKEALSGVAPCGHENRFIEWEDHSKPISCVVCEIESLRQRLAAAEARCVTLQKGVDAVQSLINESHGVSGLHLNGDVATWSSLLAGGEYEEWLREFSEAAKGGRG